MYLPREVCLKHRKIRREISCGCESFTGLAVVFVFIGSYTHCGHRSRAGLLASNQAMPVRFRLAAFHFPQSRSSQVVRQRSHTPRIAGSNPASATIFPMGRSISQ